MNVWKTINIVLKKLFLYRNTGCKINNHFTNKNFLMNVKPPQYHHINPYR